MSKRIKTETFDIAGVKFQTMMCPICSGTYFSAPTKDDLEDPAFFLATIYCGKCGWRYDLKQVETPDLKEGKNEMSLNEDKAWYADKIKENPIWDYDEATYVSKPHMCPVCGKTKFEDDLSFEICDYCGWQDDYMEDYDTPDKPTGANRLSLNDMKARYEANIKADPNYKWFKEEDEKPKKTFFKRKK